MRGDESGARLAEGPSAEAPVLLDLEGAAVNLPLLAGHEVGAESRRVAEVLVELPAGVSGGRGSVGGPLRRGGGGRAGDGGGSGTEAGGAGEAGAQRQGGRVRPTGGCDAARRRSGAGRKLGRGLWWGERGAPAIILLRGLEDPCAEALEGLREERNPRLCGDSKHGGQRRGAEVSATVGQRGPT